MGLYTNIAIANWFLDIGIKEMNLLTQMRLQKLIYFAHAHRLVTENKALVEGLFIALDYGPVLQDVYSMTSSHGSRPIASLLHVPGDIPYSLKTPVVSYNSERVRNLLEKIWARYSSFSAKNLSDLSHKPKSPWDEIYNGKGKRYPIPNHLIKDFYTKERLIDDA